MESPKEVVELVGACVAAVRNAVDVELDFTQDTLPFLDHYAGLVDSPKNEIISLVGPMCGAYFGEVLRHHFGDGHWMTPAPEYPSWRLKFDLCSLMFNPVGIAVEVLAKADAAEWGAHLTTDVGERAVAEQALKVYGDVRDTDYYTFGVRFEAVEQVYLALTRQTAKRLD